MFLRGVSGIRLNALTCVASLVLAACVFVVFWPGRTGPFLFDDFPNIVDNATVHLSRLSLDALRQTAFGYEPGSIGRPLAMLSFGLNWYFSQANPMAYKITGIAIHAVNALLVFALILSLVRTPGLGAPRRGIAFCASVALAWAIHPLQVSTVLYVVQRMEVISLTFVLLGLVLYVYGRQRQIDGRGGWPLLAASAIAALAGLLSKETAVLFGIYTLCLELFVFGFRATRLRDRSILRASYAAAMLLAAIVFLAWIVPSALAPDAYSGRNFSAYERLISQGRILVLYLQQILVPVPGRMTFYYDNFAKSQGLFEPWTTAGAFLLLALLGAAAWRVRKHRPLFALGVFWFLGAHLLTSNVINLELVFEHRNYFALLGIVLAVADLVSAVKLRDGPALKYAAVAAVVLTLGLLCTIRSATWGNPFLLFNDLVDNNPDSQRARTGLAIKLSEMANGDPGSPYLDFATAQFERAAALPGSSPLPEQGLILLATAYGRPVRNEWWHGLQSKVATLPMSAEVPSAVYDLVVRRFRGVSLDDVQLAAACQALARRKGVPAFMYARFGDYGLVYLGDQAFANEMFLKAVEAGRADPGFVYRMFRSLVEEGRPAQAELVLGRARELGIELRSP